MAADGVLTETPAVFNLISTVVTFLLGSVIGLSIGSVFYTSDDVSIKHTIALIITMVWMTSVLMQLVVPGYQTSVFTHGIMGAVTGYLFGISEAIQKRVPDPPAPWRSDNSRNGSSEPDNEFQHNRRN